MPRPQVDASLADQLNSAFATYPPDVMTIARVERAGRGLLASGDAFVGYMLLGACSAARGDAAGAKKNHKASLALSPSSTTAWKNYMVSLAILNDVSAARDAAISVCERFPNDANALKSAFGTLTELGLLQTAANSLGSHVREEESKVQDLEWMGQIDAVLSGRDVTEADIADAVAASRKFLAQQGVVRAKYSCRYLPDDLGGVGEIAYGFHIKSTPDAAHKLERQLFERLGEERLVADEAGALTFFIDFAESAS